MDEFLILMRIDLISKDKQPSPEQLQGYMKQYHDWVGSITAQNKFIGGKGLAKEGKVIRHKGVVTDGPFAEIKESLAGFIMVKAKDLDEATELAKGCPILNGEGNIVEVRQVTGGQEK